MKKLLITAAILFSVLAFSQENNNKPKTNDIDKDANVLLDSLSKVYKVKVCSIMKVTQNDVITTSIAYTKNRELVYKVIKTEAEKKD